MTLVGRNQLQMCCFVVFEQASGAVRRAGTCAYRDLAMQAAAGEAVIETAEQLDPNRVEVVDGLLVAKPSDPAETGDLP